MAEEEIITRRVVDDNEVVRDDMRDGDGIRTLLIQIIYTVLTIVNGLILLRIILSAFGANRENGFADFIYSVSQPLVSPFFGLFNSEIVYDGNGRIELESIFAILIYSLLAYVLVRIVSIGRHRRHLAH